MTHQSIVVRFWWVSAINGVLLLALVPFVPASSFGEISSAAYPWFTKAMAEYNSGKYDAALYNYSKAIELDPLCAEAYGSRALSEAPQSNCTF